MSHAKAGAAHRNCRYRHHRCELGDALSRPGLRCDRHRPGAGRRGGAAVLRRGCMGRGNQVGACARRLPGPAEVHLRPAGGPRRRRLRSGERAGAPRAQSQAVRRHRRRHAARRDHRLELVGHHDERNAGPVPASGAHRHRPPVQPTARHSPRGSCRRDEDVAGNGP